MYVFVVLKLAITQKYAYLSHQLGKDKPGVPNLQAPTTSNLIKLVMNRLNENSPLHDFSNNTKCAVRNLNCSVNVFNKANYP